MENKTYSKVIRNFNCCFAFIEFTKLILKITIKAFVVDFLLKAAICTEVVDGKLSEIALFKLYVL